MSVQHHYETLGVDESSSFEEIQEARDRLMQELASDQKQRDAIEAAYDAILMDRLRMRQEGKIKVPDRIRFPERLAEVQGASSTKPSKQPPDWLSRFIDNPDRNEVLWPAAVFAGSAFLSVFSVPAGLAVGFLASLFFLNRKEHKFLRSLLLTLLGLTVGILIGYFLGSLMVPQLNAVSLSAEAFAGISASFFFWLISSFLR